MVAIVLLMEVVPIPVPVPMLPPEVVVEFEEELELGGPLEEVVLLEVELDPDMDMEVVETRE